ncbi:hypothetical protein EJ03DRAFT_329700 [Teratosphaeria nubilosa]|uniref:Uncharacterized protein n=1 Tax=Teratosphaeria nubilosa TaxID=161662 RepID=A0A6G1L2J0_9PEZI|nr:hypothetical protein EJ03DRAFT_329700 [Teratosphaeria nubilosa]
MKLTPITLLTLTALLPSTDGKGSIEGLRCKAYNPKSDTQDISRGNRLTKFFVHDVLHISLSVLRDIKGVTCAFIADKTLLDKFLAKCQYSCIKGHPELACEPSAVLCNPR